MPYTPPPFALQFDQFPVGVEAVVLALLTFAIPVFLALWVLIDAKAQTDHPLAWSVTVLLGGLTPFYVGAIAVTILYHLSREELGSIPPPRVGSRQVGGEVLGESARERNGVERRGQNPNTTTAHAPRHEEQHGGDTVTGMGPDGQARWEGRVEAGLGVRADTEVERQTEAEMETEAERDAEAERNAEAETGAAAETETEAAYDEATSMGDGEWSGDDPAEDIPDRKPTGGTASSESEADPDIGGFEMADPVEGDSE